MPAFVHTIGRRALKPKSLEAAILLGMESSSSTNRSGRLWASDAGSCERRATMAAVIPNNKREGPASIAYYKIGNAIEDLMLDALDNQEMLLFPQYKMPDIGLNLGGYADGIIYDRGRLRVLEVKSCGSLPSSVKPEHEAQAQLYAAITGFPATVLYMSRNVASWRTGQPEMLIRSFDLPFSRKDLSWYLTRAVIARLHIKAKVTPGRPIHMKKSHCGFCLFKDSCWGTGDLPLGARRESTPREYRDIVRSAKSKVEGLLENEVVTKRQNGILLFVRKHGTNHAKTLLNGAWAPMIEPLK